MVSLFGQAEFNYFNCGQIMLRFSSFRLYFNQKLSTLHVSLRTNWIEPWSAEILENTCKTLENNEKVRKKLLLETKYQAKFTYILLKIWIILKENAGKISPIVKLKTFAKFSQFLASNFWRKDWAKMFSYQGVKNFADSCFDIRIQFYFL